jgi:hypothetical protein
MIHKTLLACTLIVTAGFLTSCTLDSRPGSYSSSSVYDTKIIDATNFAISAQSEAMQTESGETPINLQLLKILKSRQQVVAGINYQLKLLVEVDGKQRQANAVVWWQEWRQPDPYQLTSWDWVD